MGFRIDKEAKCAVVGYGSWATALVKILQENENTIFWHVKNSEVSSQLIEHGHNPKYLSSVEFNRSKLIISDDINFVVSKADIVILAVPSAFLQLTLSQLTEPLKDKFIISAIKGIMPDRLCTVAEYLNLEYNIPYKQLGVITGPCHAEEVALERLSYLNIVTTNRENGELLSQKFRCDYININLLDDIYGTEYGPVLKNIYAISVGIALGLGYGDNFISVLIANSAREMNHFLENSFAHERNTATSAYLGDLLVTCYSQFSRNRRLGLMIGKGHSVKSAKIEMDMVAEGYYAAECIQKICTSKSIKLPIAEAVYNILYKRAPARVVIKRLAQELL